MGDVRDYVYLRNRGAIFKPSLFSPNSYFKKQLVIFVMISKWARGVLNNVHFPCEMKCGEVLFCNPARVVYIFRRIVMQERNEYIRSDASMYWVAS